MPFPDYCLLIHFHASKSIFYHILFALSYFVFLSDPLKNGVENWDFLRNPQVLISFSYPKLVAHQTLFSIQDITYNNKDLDIIILELTEPSKLPPKLKLYPNETPHMQMPYVDIIGYGHPNEVDKTLDPGCIVVPAGDPKIHSAQAWLQQEKERLKKGLKENVNPDLVDWGFHGYDRPEKMIYNCYLEDGSSGGPVLMRKYQGAPVVVGVVTNGLPYCFWKLRSTAQLAFPENYRFEMGTRMTHIYKAIAMYNSNLAQELFS